MTPKQENRFKKLCKDMGALLDELQAENPNITFFIEDGSPLLLDCPSDEDPNDRHVIASGGYWHRASGGGF